MNRNLAARGHVEVIFVHLPKTGGTTIGNVFLKDRWFWRVAHHPASEIPHGFHQATWDRAYKVGMVRNPYDRFVSGFYHHYGSKVENHVEEFEQWVLERDAGSFPSHWKYAEQMYCRDGELIVDEIFKTEEHQRCIAAICKYKGIPVRTHTPQNVNRYRQGVTFDVADYYRNPEVAARIRGWAAWEFEAGGYDA
jgi:hypothetical protein